MEKFVIDASAWIEYFNGSPVGKQVHEVIASDATIFTNVINEYEVFVQSLRSRNKQAAKDALDFIENNSNVVQLNRELIEEAALLKASRGIAMADSLVAATALRFNAIILTSDSDFNKVKEAKIRLLK